MKVNCLIMSSVRRLDEGLFQFAEFAVRQILSTQKWVGNVDVYSSLYIICHQIFHLALD